MLTVDIPKLVDTALGLGVAITGAVLSYDRNRPASHESDFERVPRTWRDFLFVDNSSTLLCPKGGKIRADRGEIMPRHRTVWTVCVFGLCLLTGSLSAQESQKLTDVRKIFVEPMPNQFDQYLVAAITKELSGGITVVTSKEDADSVMKGGTEAEANGTPSTVARRVLGLDLTTGTISLLSKDGKTVLWADEAGDKSVFLVGVRRTGQRKVAERLAKDLKKAMEH